MHNAGLHIKQADGDADTMIVFRVLEIAGHGYDAAVAQ